MKMMNIVRAFAATVEEPQAGGNVGRSPVLDTQAPSVTVSGILP